MGRTTTFKAENAAVGRTVRRLRSARGLTQMQLAEKLDLSYQQIQKYEIGSNRVAVTTFLRLAAALEISTQDLLGAIEAEIAGLSQ